MRLLYLCLLLGTLMWRQEATVNCKGCTCTSSTSNLQSSSSIISTSTISTSIRKHSMEVAVGGDRHVHSSEYSEGRRYCETLSDHHR